MLQYAVLEKLNQVLLYAAPLPLPPLIAATAAPVAVVTSPGDAELLAAAAVPAAELGSGPLTSIIKLPILDSCCCRGKKTKLL